MNINGIFFSSLLGVEKVNNFSAIQNEVGKHVLPPLVFPINDAGSTVQEQTKNYITNDSTILEQDFNTFTVFKADPKRPEQSQFFPLSFSLDGVNKFLLPYEPMVNIEGQNTIIKRNVAKADGLKGSIKERWSQDDYTITISGLLIGEQEIGTMNECFPRADFEALMQILTHSREVYVYCEPLQLLGINKLVIESFSFPFTKGENVQAYEIKCTSDFSYNLLLEM